MRAPRSPNILHFLMLGNCKIQGGGGVEALDTPSPYTVG